MKARCSSETRLLTSCAEISVGRVSLRRAVRCFFIIVLNLYTGSLAYAALRTRLLARAISHTWVSKDERFEFGGGFEERWERFRVLGLQSLASLKELGVLDDFIVISVAVRDDVVVDLPVQLGVMSHSLTHSH